MKNILLIGCGHMGSALLESWKKNKYYRFTIIDPVQYKKIKNKYKNNKINCLKDPSKIKNTKIFDIVVLAVKPQITNAVLNNYKSLNFKKTTVLVSIVAGKKINYLKKSLPNLYQFVRVMPNMPALIEEGVSCLVASNLSKINKKNLEALFSKVGIVLWLSKESKIDIVTAISGSGPGYVFYIIDAIEKAANNLGLNNNINKKIILQTFIGSLKLLKKSNKSAHELAETIAIKGGTTEAGINTMKNNNIHKIMKKTLISAYKRSLFLGKK